MIREERKVVWRLEAKEYADLTGQRVYPYGSVDHNGVYYVEAGLHYFNVVRGSRFNRDAKNTNRYGACDYSTALSGKYSRTLHIGYAKIANAIQNDTMPEPYLGRNPFGKDPDKVSKRGNREVVWELSAEELGLIGGYDIAEGGFTSAGVLRPGSTYHIIANREGFNIISPPNNVKHSGGSFTITYRYDYQGWAPWIRQVATAIKENRMPEPWWGKNPFTKEDLAPESENGVIKVMWRLSNDQMKSIYRRYNGGKRCIVVGLDGFSVLVGSFYGKKIGDKEVFSHKFDSIACEGQYFKDIAEAIKHDMMPCPPVAGVNPFATNETGKVEIAWRLTPQQLRDIGGPVVAQNVYLSAGRRGYSLFDYEDNIGKTVAWQHWFNEGQEPDEVFKAIRENRVNDYRICWGINPYDKRIKPRNPTKTRPSLRVGDMVKRKRLGNGSMYRVIGIRAPSVERLKLKSKAKGEAAISQEGFADIKVRGLDGIERTFKRRDLWRVPNQPRDKPKVVGGKRLGSCECGCYRHSNFSGCEKAGCKVCKDYKASKRRAVINGLRCPPVRPSHPPPSYDDCASHTFWNAIRSK